MRRTIAWLADYLLLIALSIIGFVAGGVLVVLLTQAAGKWSIFFYMMISGLVLLLLLNFMRRSVSNLLFFFAVSSIPILYDINFMYEDNIRFSVLANGLGVRICDVLFVGLVALWLLDYVNKKTAPFENRVPKTFLWGMGLALIWNLGSSYFAETPFFGYSMAFIQFKLYIIFGYIVYNTNEMKIVRFFTYAVGVILFMEGVIAIEQKVLGVIFTSERLGQLATWENRVGTQVITRVSGTLGQPNAFAMFMNQFMLIGIFGALTERSTLKKLFLLTAVILAIIAEIFTASRGGWMGLAIAFVISMTLWMTKKGKSPVISLALISIISTSIFGLLFSLSQTFRDRLTQEDYGTAEIRYPLMEVAVNMIEDNPWYGVGLNHYTRYMKDYDRTFDQIATIFAAPVHNTYLLIAAETGVISALLVVIFLLYAQVFAFRLFWRSDGLISAVSLGIFGGNLSWMIHWLVDPTTFYGSYAFWICTAMLFGMSVVHRNQVRLLDSLGKNNEPNT